MKSIRRGQHLITIMLLVFPAGFGYLLYRLQHNAGFYISHAKSTPLGYVYDRKGEILFDPEATAGKYDADYFIDIGNLIGDNSKQMTNTLVAQNLPALTNYSFTLGERSDGHAAIYCTLDHEVNRKVYDAFGAKDGCAVAYNYKTGEIYVCFSKPSVNILDGYSNIEFLPEGSLLCTVFSPTVPGSMQKIATTAAAFETMGNAVLDKRYACAGSYTNLGGQVIRCHAAVGHGEQGLSEAFANSCNPFFAQLVEDPAWTLDDIAGVYRKMGYRINNEGEQTYLEFDGLSAYTASTTLIDKTDFNTQWGCMGQGMTLVSPLQMMVWQSAIANTTGISTMPYLIGHTTTVTGKTAQTASTAFGEAMFSEQTAASVREIMLENGRGHYAELLPGTDVGVKSGTAQVENGDKENSLLTGFVDDPAFPVAFCIRIDDRKSGEVTTSQIAAVLLQELKASLNE